MVENFVGDGESTLIDIQTNLELIAGIFSIIALVLSMWTIWRHLSHYRAPEKQRRIVRIVLMVPIYSFSSWLSLSFVQSALYFDTIRDCYEAYVLYQFFLLCVSYIGGENCVKKVLERKPDMAHPWPCGYCFPKLVISEPKFYLNIKRGILQYCIVKPVMAIISLILEAASLYCNGNWNFNCGYMYICVISNLSVSISLYCLVLFYDACHRELAQWKPIWKFVCVKAVIFFSYWQGVIFSILVFTGVIKSVGTYSTDDLAAGMQDFLICIEMILAAIAHYFVFSHTEYAQLQWACLDFGNAIRDVIQIGDVVYDTRVTFNIFPPEYQRLEYEDMLPRAQIPETVRSDEDDGLNENLNFSDENNLSPSSFFGDSRKARYERWTAKNNNYGSTNIEAGPAFVDEEFQDPNVANPFVVNDSHFNSKD